MRLHILAEKNRRIRASQCCVNTCRGPVPWSPRLARFLLTCTCSLSFTLSSSWHSFSWHHTRVLFINLRQIYLFLSRQQTKGSRNASLFRKNYSPCSRLGVALLPGDNSSIVGQRRRRRQRRLWLTTTTRSARLQQRECP